ncbi:hypothetical protein ACOBQB_10815 [Streptomyces sp. G5(2025)]|uniref:hypothetical protein n=1 Tax=Streptomyces sp. G5(2025) TaxID=3406628 RepID=UPI003C216BCE
MAASRRCQRVLTTVVHLGQALGIAVTGTLFFSLREGAADDGDPLPLASSAAMSSVAVRLAVLAVAGAAGGIALTRAVRQAQRAPREP